MANSINTNISAYFAQANISAASSAASASVSRLSSGNRIVKASDDVAALSTGTSLRTQVTALKTALTNTAQGTSLLQVADGALSQVTEILQRQKAIALQAGSGSLTDTDRGYLDQEFQALSTEVDRLTGATNFNGVKLLDGGLSQAAKVATSTAQASTASATLTLATNLANNDTLVINGVTLTAKTSASAVADFAIGATTADTITNLKNVLNTLASSSATFSGSTTYATALGGVNYSVNGSNSSTLNISSRTGGTLGDKFTLTAGTSNATTTKVNIGGQYGGASINLISTGVGFASATTAITSGTASQSLTVPFKAGDTIKATIGGSSAVSLYTVQADDSLTKIAAGINSNSATSGFTAVIVPGSTSGYNIELHTANATGNISLNGGDHYFATAATGAQTYALNGATSTVNLLSSNLAAAAGASLVDASAATAVKPFVDGSNIYISIAGGAKAALLDAGSELATGDTLSNIVTKINNSAAAGALGVSAAVNGSNIAITYNDPTQTGTTAPSAISFTSGLNSTTQNTFNTDASGQSFGNGGLNGAYTTFNLLATGLNAPDSAVVSSNGSGTANAPIEAGTAITVAFNSDATTISASPLTISSTLTAGWSLQQIAGDINSNSVAKANGIHAQVVQDAGGKYNIQLQYASSAAPLVGTGGTASLTGVRIAYDNSTVNAGSSVANDSAVTLHSGNAAVTNYTTYSLFNNAFASTLSAGQAVVATTASVLSPFQAGEALTVDLNNGAVSVDLLSGHASANGDTLGDLVNKINLGTATSHFSASLDGNGTNILIKYQGVAVTDARASFNGGAHFFNNTDPTAGAINNTNGLKNSYSSANLFATGITTGSGGAYVISAGAASNGSANVPFGSDAVITLRVGGSAVSSAITVGVAATAQSLIDQINTNATAKSNGIHAELVDSAGVINIQITQADIANTGAAAGVIDFTVTNALQTNTFASHAINTAASTYTAVDSILQKANALTANVGNGAVGLTNLGSFGLAGGSDNGIGYGTTSVTGTIGDNLLTGLAQSKAHSIISFPDIDASALTAAGNFNSDGSVSLTVGGHAFKFVTAPSAVDEIKIGASLKETLDNAVSTINSYGAKSATGDTAFQLNQVNVSRNGNSLVIEGKGISDVTTIAGGASAVTLSGFTNGAAVSSANLSNSSRDGAGTFGVDVSGISNKDFNGTVQGFTASYVSANTVNLSVKVGDYTYTANNVDTNPISGNKVIRFLSDQVGSGATATNGGFFDVQLSNNNGQTVSPSTSTVDANHYAQRLNAAFNGLDFAQSRQISSYSGTASITSGTTLIGSLLGSSVSAKLSSYSANKLTNIEVDAPPAGGGDAKITLTIDGQQYSSSSLGSQLGANQTYRFTNTVDSSKYVDFRTGTSSIDLSTSTNAKAVQTALSQAFGVSNGGGALSFQIGSDSTDVLAVSIGSAQTSNLFDGKTLNVLTQANATIASDQLDKALQAVTTLRASVGALQSRFNYAAANIQIAVQNQDAARSALLDTDVAAESTSYATSQVKLQAGISVLAQANQQLQNLLKLIQ